MNWLAILLTFFNILAINCATRLDRNSFVKYSGMQKLISELTKSEAEKLIKNVEFCIRTTQMVDVISHSGAIDAAIFLENSPENEFPSYELSIEMENIPSRFLFYKRDAYVFNKKYLNSNVCLRSKMIVFNNDYLINKRPQISFLVDSINQCTC